jgi:hypothetical protein
MKSRALLVAPFLAAALYIVALRALGQDRATFYFVEALTVKALALAACVAAALRFERGDRMRTIWMLFVVDFALLLAKELVVHPAATQLLGLSPTTVLRALCLLGANVAGTLAWITLARTWRVAGLTLDGSPAAQRALLVVAIGAGLALVGWGTASDLRLLWNGRGDAVLNIISDVADVVGFSLAAPVALTAWTLRGGSLSWPYLYLTACTFSWMLFDMTQALGGSLGLAPAAVRSIEELWRCVACALHVSAALSTRWAVGRAAAAAPSERQQLSA